MKTTIKSMAATLAVILVGTVATMERASAGCAAPGAVRSPAVWQEPKDSFGLMPVGDFNDGASIVGLWKFKLSGFLTDFGTQAFHAGGTEMMFSAGVDPATGDVCQGVWRKVGPSTYTLNHIAMAWTAPGAEYGVLIRIHMLLKLAPSGNSFTGTYNVSLFAETPQDPFDESAGPFVTGSGTATGTRVKPD